MFRRSNSHRRRRLGTILIALPCVALMAASSGHERRASAQTEAVTLADIDGFRELLIVHPTVVDAYLNGRRSHNGGPALAVGRWSFRGLMEDIMREANGGEVPSAAFRDAFLTQLFESWLTPQQLSTGQTLPARDPVQVENLVLAPFSTVDGGTGSRSFELWKAPFELIAIVNRADLAPTDSSNAGELRFVFKLVHPEQGDQKLTLIIEYEVPVSEFDSSTWAHLWHQLSALEIGSDEYLRKLEFITNHVTRWKNSESSFPRRVARIRTNEIALAPATDEVWEMREFAPGPDGSFSPVAPFNQPALALNDTTVLSCFAQSEPDLGSTDGSAMSIVIPETFTDCSDPPQAVSMLDSRAAVGEPWVVPGATAVVNDNFGMLTCNGCHNDHAAPKAFDFYHLAPEFPQGTSIEELLDGTGRLSLFLTDERPHADGSGAAPSELQRRKLEQLTRLQTPCTINQCVAGTQCVVDEDCPSFPPGKDCVNGRCSYPAHCTNWGTDVADGESDQDCSGDCTYCYYGRSCFQNSDCWPNATCSQGVCVP